MNKKSLEKIFFPLSRVKRMMPVPMIFRTKKNERKDCLSQLIVNSKY